jgi:ribosomal protein S14
MRKPSYWEPISKARKVQKTAKLVTKSANSCDFCCGPRGTIDMGNDRWSCRSCFKEMNSDI